jgi:hypothetical protein
MLLHLAEQLGVPMRDRNVLLVAAGYAPIFRERSLRDPALAAARAAIDLVLDRQKPYPAFALDRHWCIPVSTKLKCRVEIPASQARSSWLMRRR